MSSLPCFPHTVNPWLPTWLGIPCFDSLRLFDSLSIWVWSRVTWDPWWSCSLGYCLGLDTEVGVDTGTRKRGGWDSNSDPASGHHLFPFERCQDLSWVLFILLNVYYKNLQANRKVPRIFWVKNNIFTIHKAWSKYMVNLYLIVVKRLRSNITWWIFSFFLVFIIV